MEKDSKRVEKIQETMKKITITEKGKTCELIIFEKYEHTYPKNEFKRISNLIDFRKMDRNSFDIRSKIHSGFFLDEWIIFWNRSIIMKSMYFTVWIV